MKKLTMPSRKPVVSIRGDRFCTAGRAEAVTIKVPVRNTHAAS